MKPKKTNYEKNLLCLIINFHLTVHFYPRDDLVISVFSPALAAHPPHIKFYIITIFIGIGDNSG